MYFSRSNFFCLPHGYIVLCRKKDIELMLLKSCDFFFLLNFALLDCKFLQEQFDALMLFELCSFV